MATESLGKLVQRARRARNLTQVELAQSIGCPKNWIVDVERGKVIPVDLATVQALSYQLHLDTLALWSMALEELNRKKASCVGRDWELVGEDSLAATATAEIARAPARSYAAIEKAAESLVETLFGGAVSFGSAIPVLSIATEPHRSRFAQALFLSSPIQLEEAHPAEANGIPVEGSAEFDSHAGAFIVKLRSDVWERAQAGDGRPRFSVAHELGHIALHGELLQQERIQAFRDQVCTASQKLTPGLKIYESPEWQASAWAGAFLMPGRSVSTFLRMLNQTGEESSIAAIAERFQVSMQAARIRLEKLLPRLSSEEFAK